MNIVYEYWPIPHVILAFTLSENSTTENPIHHSATVLWNENSLYADDEIQDGHQMNPMGH